MLGGFSSKNGPALFSFPSTRSAPSTMKDWKYSLIEAKRMYLQKQYKQCAAYSMKLLSTAKGPIDPVCKTFLTFYAAISYEFLGRAAHLYSANKVALLRQALESFVECDAALPPLVNLPRLAKLEVHDMSWSSTPISVDECLALFEPPKEVRSDRDSIMDNITRMIDVTISRLDDPFVDGFDELDEFVLSCSPSRIPRPIQDRSKEDLLAPSPLRIRKFSDEKPLKEKIAEKKVSEKKVANNSSPKKSPKKSTQNTVRLSMSGDENNSSGRFRPPRLPLKVIPSSRLNANMSGLPSPKSELSSPVSPSLLFSPIVTGFPTPDSTPPKVTTIPIENLSPTRAAQIFRSNRGIAFLHELVTSSIYSIRQQIQQVKQFQEVRRARNFQRASSWTFDAILAEKKDSDSDANQGYEPIMDEFGHIMFKETMDERIIRLRAEGWEMVGLRSPRSTWKGARYYQEFCAMVMNERDLDS
ncbi:hypothetical protein N7520_006769 [Penicillium odoratum]|uniref:uncharacterized protein n=1 Tax=Penicillium odoratum TaxID=1167516 RepID=UPI0025473109|nr:uncharacterized protein N7520_006769 [Penicillium odoratum]KAJ5759613.1 hypothetical protein N7520_006769 [Penicillium odoratum]